MSGSLLFIRNELYRWIRSGEAERPHFNRAANPKVASSKPKQTKQNATTGKQSKAATPKTIKGSAIEVSGGNGRRDMALTVRIEINLPAGGSKETYDNIFKSIRANLIDE